MAVAAEAAPAKVGQSSVIMTRRPVVAPVAGVGGGGERGGEVKVAKATLSALGDAYFILNGSSDAIGRTCRSQVDGDNATPGRPCDVHEERGARGARSTRSDCSEVNFGQVLMNILSSSFSLSLSDEPSANDSQSLSSSKPLPSYTTRLHPL